MRVHRNCCGLDVHKKIVAACLIKEDGEGNSIQEKRLFGSMTRDLQELAQWLSAAQVTAVAMKATGVYWKPVVSWAGVCPGNNQTGGKRKSGTTRAGNPWIRRALCEAAWAASKTKGTYLQAQFRRLAALRGPKRALIAVANSILTAGYYMLQRATTYQDLGPDYFDKRNTVRATHRLVKRLEALGHRVILEPRFIADPSS